MIQEMDRWFFDCVFERFAHWFQKWTGYTNFWLAKWCMIIWVSLDVIWAAQSEKAGPWILTALLVAVLPLMIYGYEKEEKRFLGEKVGCKNDREASNVFLWMRIIILWMVVTTVVQLGLSPAFDMLRNFLRNSVFLCWAYFIACTPLPRGPAKLRQAWNKFLSKAIDWIGPPPEPVKAN